MSQPDSESSVTGSPRINPLASHMAYLQKKLSGSSFPEEA